MDKRYDTATEAVGEVADGSTVLIGGFGDAGFPFELVDALAATGARDLTLVANNAGHSSPAFLTMVRERRVRRVVCTYPIREEPTLAEALQDPGFSLELVPQGTLAERIRAAGAGIPAFYTPTAAGTLLAEGKEVRSFGGTDTVLETAFHADLALVRADRGDRWGNLTYRLAARNYNPVMATAARRTVAQVREAVELGELDPEAIVTPGIYVSAVWEVR